MPAFRRESWPQPRRLGDGLLMTMANPLASGVIRRRQWKSAQDQKGAFPIVPHRLEQ
jgi:hypothetical protein